MSKGIIRKNLSDAEMFAGCKEELTFENNPGEDVITRKPHSQTAKQQVKKEEDNSFLPAELHQLVSKALLELKLQLYKEGVVDYSLKVTREGRQVILSAVPKGVEKKGKPKK